MKFLSSKALIAVWSAVLQWARVGMNAVVFLVLSRWLSLSEIGVVAAVQAPVIILQSLMTTMLPEFVVQEKFLSQRRLSSIFWLAVGTGALLSGSLVLASPLLTAGLDDPQASTYLLALSVCPLLWAIAGISEGLQRRSLDTKKLALRTVFASTTAACVAISAGYVGWGGWAIVLFTLTSTCLSAGITVLSIAWRPSKQMQWPYLRTRRKRMQALIGRHMLGAATMPIMQYATAVQLGTNDAGIFQIAVRVYALVESIVMTPYRFVVMPLFAMAKKSQTELAALTEKAVSLGCVIAVPAYVGLLVIAPSLIPLVVGERNGHACVLAVQFLSLNGILSASAPVVNQILVARGHAIVVFRRSMLQYLFAITPAVIATLHSVHAVTLVYGLVGGITSLALAWSFSQRYLQTQVRAMAVSWVRVLLAGCCLLPLMMLNNPSLLDSPLVRVIIIVLTAPVIYAASLTLLAKKEMTWLLQVVKSKR